MTTNSEMVLNFLKNNYGKEFTKQEIAGNLGISLSSVIGSMNWLVKRNYATITRVETVEVAPATETSKGKTKEVPYHTLTEAGLAYDPVAEAEALAAAKAAKKANA